LASDTKAYVKTCQKKIGQYIYPFIVIYDEIDLNFFGKDLRMNLSHSN